MRFVTRIALTLILGAAASALAQQTPPTATTAETAASATDTATVTTETAGAAATEERSRNAHEIKSDFRMVLGNYPQELGTILALDPTLLSNEAFLTEYPRLASFVAEHPEVRRSPRFFLGEYVARQSSLDKIIEPVMIFASFALIAFALAWLVRTVIEQKRWNRLSRIQTETHNKILDRFGTTGELLEYVKSPAGSKFLESAPIPLHAEQPAANAPLTRVMWSIQIGIVVAAGALGMLIVASNAEKESAEGLFALGVIGLCIGGGFIASAAVSMFLSRRLGLPNGQTPPSDRLDLVR